MSFGGDSPPSYKAPSTYLGNLSQTRTLSPFADTSSRFRNKRDIDTGKRFTGKNAIELMTEIRPKEFVQRGIDTGGDVMNTNLEYLTQDPSQRFAAITGGNDLYYNVLRDQLESAEDKALGRARLFGQSRGLSDSTTQGAAIAGIMDDSLKREREAQLAAFNLGQQTATTNTGTGLAVLSGLNSILQPQASANLSALGSLRKTGEEINMQNAMREYQSKLAQYQAQQANQSAWGRAIGALTGPVGGGIFSAITGNPSGLQTGTDMMYNIAGAALPYFTGGMSGIGNLGSAGGVFPGIPSPRSGGIPSRGGIPNWVSTDSGKFI